MKSATAAPDTKAEPMTDNDCPLAHHHWMHRIDQRWTSEEMHPDGSVTRQGPFNVEYWACTECNTLDPARPLQRHADPDRPRWEDIADRRWGNPTPASDVARPE